MFVDSVAGLVLLGAAGFAVLGVMVLLRRSPEVRDDLSNRWRLHTGTGDLSPVGA